MLHRPKLGVIERWIADHLRERARGQRNPWRVFANCRLIAVVVLAVMGDVCLGTGCAIRSIMPRLFRIAVATSVVALAALSGLAGCSSSDDTPSCLEGEDCQAARQGDVGDPVEITGPLCADMGRSHVGLGGVELTEGRGDGLAHGERGRMKPYTALTTEYARVLGDKASPQMIKETGSTFGGPPARWFIEPQPGAVNLYTAFNVGFEACLRTTGGIPVDQVTPDPKFKEVPTDGAVRPQCADWVRKFWSRDGSPEEIQGCVDVALGSPKETVADNGNLQTRDTTPERRWAYACASVLTATGFLSY